MPRTEEQLLQLRDDKRSLIMEKALVLFAEQGYHNTPVSKIARAAKISKGLIYNYFKSKEELLKEILLSNFEIFTKLFDPNKDGILTEDELKFFIDKSFEVIKQNKSFWRLYFSLILQKDVSELLYAEFIKSVGHLFDTLSKYYAKKNIENPELTAQLVFAAFDGIIINYLIAGDAFPLETAKTTVYNLLSMNHTNNT